MHHWCPGALQDVTKHQKLVAKTLGIPQHKLVSKTKRLGGGFGGKETRSAFLHCATAVAAYHLRRPVKLVLPRQADMQVTGHRHAFLGRYKAAAAADGRILALDLQLFSNAGAAALLPPPCCLASTTRAPGPTSRDPPEALTLCLLAQATAWI
jgi:xanthine dehydrogenase molybdopterin-binding subunit B